MTCKTCVHCIPDKEFAARQHAVFFVAQRGCFACSCFESACYGALLNTTPGGQVSGRFFRGCDRHSQRTPCATDTPSLKRKRNTVQRKTVHLKPDSRTCTSPLCADCALNHGGMCAALKQAARLGEVCRFHKTKGGSNA
jgi:hypothetical protein